MQSINRRTALAVGSMPYLTLSFPRRTTAAQSTARIAAAAKSCILIWLDGGPSHIDTLDPKPDAPSEVRGPMQSISTSIPGIAFSEVLPRLASRLHRCGLVRSVTSPLGEHNLGTQYMLTGYKPSPVLQHATYGSVLSATQGADHSSALPNFIAIPDFRVGGANFSGNGFLAASTAPFEVHADPAKPGFTIDGLAASDNLDATRLGRRRRFLNTMNKKGDERREDPVFEQAFEMLLSSQTSAAFDLTQESDKLRNSYGPKTIGQSCLLARRLVEQEVPLITVNHRGWDTHKDLTTRLKDGFTGAKRPVGLGPSLDQAVAALLDDLSDRGLLDTTLIAVMGEFGRTPKLNVSGGRDHWPRVFSVLMAGGGIRAGTIVGSSDRLGESPREDPVTPADLAWTIYDRLGIDPEARNLTDDDRPIQIGAPGGQVIQALVS